MTKHLWTVLTPTFVGLMILPVGIAQAQSIAQGQQDAPAASSITPERTSPSQASGTDGLSPAELPGGKVGLVRGVVKRTDLVHDQLVIHVFGGGDVRIDFDTRTRVFPENARLALSSLPAGAVVSVDTVIDNGKLFARSIRTGQTATSGVELSGKIVRYDVAKSRLILRDPISPENVSLRITPSTQVIDQGHPSSTQALSQDILVRVWFSRETASKIEILAKPGDSFTFEGRIISVDLRSRVLALSNNTDQSIRELAISSLDRTSLALLQEGADVNIQAQFDGDHYNVRTVTRMARTQ